MLSACRELRELEFEISAHTLNEMELEFISSITSTNIEKVIINRSADLDYPVGDAVWTQLDDILTKLAERRECKLVRLEVELWGNWSVVVGKEFDQKMTYLPKFVGKGRMRVWDCWNSHPIYCSDDRKERECRPYAMSTVGGWSMIARNRTGDSGEGPDDNGEGPDDNGEGLDGSEEVPEDSEDGPEDREDGLDDSGEGPGDSDSGQACAAAPCTVTSDQIPPRLKEERGSHPAPFNLFLA